VHVFLGQSSVNMLEACVIGGRHFCSFIDFLSSWDCQGEHLSEWVGRANKSKLINRLFCRIRTLVLLTDRTPRVESTFPCVREGEGINPEGQRHRQREEEIERRTLTMM